MGGDADDGRRRLIPQVGGAIANARKVHLHTLKAIQDVHNERCLLLREDFRKRNEQL